MPEKQEQFYFMVQAFEQQVPTGGLVDVVQIELLDTNADSALARAEKLIKKKFYRIQSIVQKTEDTVEHKEIKR